MNKGKTGCVIKHKDGGYWGKCGWVNSIVSAHIYKSEKLARYNYSQSSKSSWNTYFGDFPKMDVDCFPVKVEIKEVEDE